MKVTIVVECFPQVSETFVINHVVSLIKKGHEVKVISLNRSSQKVTHQIFNDFDLSEITYYEREHTPSALLRYSKHLKQLFLFSYTSPKSLYKLLFSNSIKQKRSYLTSHKYKEIYNTSDIIHTHFGPIGKRIIELKKIGFIKSNIPVVCSFHGYDIDSPKYYLNRKYYKDFFENISAILSNSFYLKNKLIETGCSPDKIHVVKIGVDTEKFTKEKTARSQNYNILTVARLIDVKGIIYAIKAMSLLVAKGITKFTYNIIGDGELFPDLERNIKELNISGYVNLLGSKSQEEIIDYYSKSDVFILPSIISSEGRAEAQGLVIQEAQAMELPVIVTDVGGIADGIIPGETGFLIPEKSPEAIADKVEYLMLHPKFALEMGKKGREFVKTKFDLKVIAEQTIDIYNDLLDGKN